MPKKVREIHRLTDEEMREMASGLVCGRIFTGSQVPQDMLYSVFMPLLFMKPPPDWDNVGNVVEDIDKRLEMGINGYPVFMSCRIVHKNDWAAVAERAIKVKEAFDAALTSDDAE